MRRHALPPHLCPEGFEPLADYLRATSAPPEVWAALRHAQTGAVQLRAAAVDALRCLDTGGPMKIDAGDIADKARQLVLDAATIHGLDGLDRRKAAAKRLAEWLDSQVNPKGPIGRVIDAFDGPVWLAVAEGVIETAYRGLRGEGAL